MVPTHARMLSLASYRATASFLDSYQPRIQIQPRPLYSLLNISDILRPAMVRVRRVTVLICGSVCSRLPASHPHGLKSYNNNHFRIFLTLFSVSSTKMWRKKHSIDYWNDSKVDMKGFWTDFPPRVWWWWLRARVVVIYSWPCPATAPHCDVRPGGVMPAHSSLCQQQGNGLIWAPGNYPHYLHNIPGRGVKGISLNSQYSEIVVLIIDRQL